MTTWTDETMPTTAWGTNFLLINATDALLIGATAGEYVLIDEDSGTPL